LNKPDSDLDQVDPFPEGKILTVGQWALEKHELLKRYVHASWAARQKWPNPCFIDLFCGPGRVRIRDTDIETDGGALVAWRKALTKGGRFAKVVIGDLDAEALSACAARLTHLGADVTALHGAAETTVEQVLQLIPQDGLHLAYLDPFNMGHLPFSVIQKLAKFKKIDIVVHFSVMDLQRDFELDFERDASRFEVFAPGWKSHVNVQSHSKQQARLEFVKYWLELVKSVGFKCSEEKPLMTNSKNGPLYRMMFLSRHPLGDKLWTEINRGLNPNRSLF
jgi:three-Cys-motif partner protein